MEWALAVIALSLIGFGMVSRRVDGTSLTPAIVFVGVGLLVGAHALDLLDVSPTGESVKLLAEATLTLVLFVDASRIDLRTLRSEYAVPARLLGVGLPLTIALGAAVGSALFGALSVPEAVLLAVVLAPTDAALGQAVVTEPRLPSRIRQGLNVESGLNDGICVPLLFIVLAIAEADAGEVASTHAVRLVVEEIGYGIAAGALAGVVTAIAITYAGNRRLIERSWLQIVPVAGAALAYGLAAPVGGSGFIAAFVAGMTFGALRQPVGESDGEATLLTDELGELLNGVTLLVFGAVAALARARRPDLANRALRRREPDHRPHGTGCHRDARHRRPPPDGGVPRLVRPARPGLDRVRRHHRAGGRSPAHEHDPPDDLRHRRTLRPPPRRHCSATGEPLRIMVRITCARCDACDGERSRRHTSVAAGALIPPSPYQVSSISSSVPSSSISNSTLRLT